MYTLRYIGIPREKRDLDGVWALLVECDRDFVPRLSERSSTSQSALEMCIRDRCPPWARNRNIS